MKPDLPANRVVNLAERFINVLPTVSGKPTGLTKQLNVGSICSEKGYGRINLVFQ